MKRIIKVGFSFLFIIIFIVSPILSISAEARMPGSYDASNEDVCEALSYYWNALDDQGTSLVNGSKGPVLKFKDGTGNTYTVKDWDADSNSTVFNNTKTKGSGKDGFSDILNQLSSNNASSVVTLDCSTTFGDSIDNILTDFTKNAQTSHIYTSVRTTIDNLAYVGCDYDKASGKFLYYCIGAFRAGAQKDDFVIHVFKSEQLYLLTQADADCNQWGKVFGKIHNFIIYNGTSAFSKCIESDYNSEYMGMIDRLNKILLVEEAPTSETNSISVKLSYGTINLNRTVTGNIKITTDPIIGSDVYTADLSGIREKLGSSRENGDNTTSTDGNSLFTGAIVEMISEMALAQNGVTQSNIENALSKGYFGSADDNDFSYELISYLKDVLEQLLKDLQFDLVGEGCSLSEYGDDYFRIMNMILMRNVKHLYDPSSMPMDGSYDLASGENIIVTVSGENINQSNYTYGLLDIWDKLDNDYQRNVLAQEYMSKLSSLGLTSESPDVFEFIEQPSISAGGELYPGDTLTVKELMSKYENDIEKTYNVECVARNCNIIARYIVATTLFVKDGSKDNGNDPFEIYDLTLEQLGAENWTYEDASGSTSNSYLSWMPKHIGVFGDDDGNYTVFGYADGGWSRFVTMLFNVEWGFETFDKSLYGEEHETSANALLQYFKGNMNYKPTGEGNWALGEVANSDGLKAFYDQAISWNFENNQNMITLFRSIIELHKMCEYLGIDKDDWSDCIKAYLEIYDEFEDFFRMLENNPYIYAQAATGVMNEVNPLGAFFSIDNKAMSDQWDKGFALSALYVPMETNLYNAEAVTFVNDPDWISEFYYKYAFYRKALYVNTDGSAIVNKAVTGDTTSGRKVATLKDLLNYDRDIILWVDDNFYNANQVSDIISKVDYTAIRNAAMDAEKDTESVDTGLLDSFGNWAAGLFDLDAGTILKTGANQYYSENLAKNVTQLGTDSNIKTRIYDSYILSSDEIIGSADGEVDSVLDDYEYSVKQSYGVVSAIYRNAELYNECLIAITSDNAIFKSSKNICKTPGTSSKDWVALYNYCMLSNLESQLKNNTNTTLDLDAPIFCDLFGNIITESGLVIIPAATNSTLCGAYWSPYTVGWSEYYNNGNRIECDELLDDVYTWLMGTTYIGPNTSAAPELYSNMQDVTKINAGGYMSIDTTLQLVLRDVELTSNSLTGIIQFEMPNKNSEVVQQLFYNDAYYEKAKKIYSHTLTNLVVETLRGAPIEYINYEYESISGNTDISKYGVYLAYKLEELMNSMISGMNGNSMGGNTVVTMPNLAFVSGVEYIMLYVFKIVFALLIVALVVQLYLDATKNSLGIKSVGKFIMTCLMVLVAFTLVPKLVSWSYYKANKDLLAKEAGYIMMLNYVKEYDGSEIGITTINTPETQTELYLRVADVSVAWWDIIPDVLFGNTFATVTELYENQLKSNAMAMQEYVQLKGDGLYVNVQDVFDSTNLMYTPTNSMLINYSTSLNAYVHDVENKIIGEDEDHNPIYSYGSWADQQLAYDEGTGQTIWQDIETTAHASDFINDNAGLLENGGRGEITIDPNDRDSVVSFICPYYVILDQLVANINEYNLSRGVQAYGWGVGANGHVLTYDILTPYLTSAEFLEDGYDIIGIEAAIGLENPQPSYNRVITDEDQAKIQWSLWYPNGVTNSLKATRVEELHEYARDYIADNRYIIGKVPDEVFLKVFAMQLAMKYNDIFNISQGNAIEIINVDTRDMMRFMIGDKPNVYKYYSYGFARYCYEEGGIISVVFASFLTVIYWLTSFLKPLAMLIILALLIINCVFRKLLFRKESRCIEGYLIGAACLCMCNYMYALMLKLSMIVTDLGMGSVTALVVAFVIQVAYVAGLMGIVSIEIKDWKNSGFNEFATIGGNIASGLVQARNVIAEKIIARNSETYNGSTQTSEYVRREYDRSSVEQMLERDAEREERGTFSPD